MFVNIAVYRRRWSVFMVGDMFVTVVVMLISIVWSGFSRVFFGAVEWLIFIIVRTQYEEGNK